MDALKLPGQREGETLDEAVNRLLDDHNGNTPLLPHISNDSIEALYAFAHGFYESGHFEKAMHFFRFLTMLDISTRKHWLGLGASYQMLKQYERALQCYAQAALLDETDPYTHWHAAECFFAIKKYEQAKEALNSTELTAKKFPKRYSSLLEKIQLIKTGSLKKAKKKKTKRSK